MGWPWMDLAVSTPLAAFVDVFQIVVGVILSLTGLGLLVTGLMALARRTWGAGSLSSGLGLVLLVAGFWLVGVIG